jgi:hypothetical protein
MCVSETHIGKPIGTHHVLVADRVSVNIFFAIQFTSLGTVLVAPEWLVV